ncbi:FAD:protein FMN transferase [Shimia sagamensis]|uniref:FAD:protein FMN transferase n=1 Tax=Shimia sagamensis TaxID=1566352 RepID=A0ABY1P507_9RHOB|nr:FAD:protein FMN transferase [Shimia sagamensis]SMP25689.1 thiamine biosynthesis lipoprotein [Shimia sagamensis]
MTALSRRSFIFMTLALAACKRGAADLLLSGQTMGTSYTVVAVEPPGGLDEGGLKAAIDAVLADIDQKMSNWNPVSEISQINALSADTPHTLSADMLTLLNAANGVHKNSDGQFDLTLGPLIDLWGFGAQKPTSRIPSDSDVTEAMHSVGQTNTVLLEGSTLTKSRDGTQMYLSAIGKGYGVDRLGDALRALGVTDFMVEIGGDIITSGQNAEGMPWQIAIETPDARQRSFLKVLGVSNLGMATSGDYRNYFEQEGVRYSHIIDAQTGRPVTHPTASVTVLTQNAMLADAWATALLVLGKDRGMEIAERQNLAALFIDREVTSGKMHFKTYATDQFASIQHS